MDKQELNYIFIKKGFKDLSDEQRLNIMSDYCPNCGCGNPDCQCENDE